MTQIIKCAHIHPSGLLRLACCVEVVVVAPPATEGSSRRNLRLIGCKLVEVSATGPAWRISDPLPPTHSGRVPCSVFSGELLRLSGCCSRLFVGHLDLELVVFCEVAGHGQCSLAPDWLANASNKPLPLRRNRSWCFREPLPSLVSLWKQAIHLARKVANCSRYPCTQGIVRVCWGKDWAFPGRQKGSGVSRTLLFCMSKPASGGEVFEFPH